MNADMMILRAKVKLQNEHPFFAYLVMNLTFKENKDIESIGVSIKDKGLCVYNPTWIETLKEEELRGILAHEVLHLVLEHLTHLREKDILLWNIATDLCINYMLVENGFQMYSKGLIPTKSLNSSDGYTFDFKGVITIKHIEEKTAEQIYNELISNKQIQKIKKELDEMRGDIHEYSEGDKALTKEEIAESKDKWKNAVGEAVTHARQKGNLPKGLELFVDKLQNAKINWKQMLYKYITRVIPFDYTYCVDKNTLISTPRGLKPIYKLRQGRNVIGYKNGKGVYSTIKSKWKTRVKEKYTIETQSGKKIICSPLHKILTKRGYIQARCLNKNDEVISLI